MDYLLGIFLGVMAGLTNFLGQVLQKKAINDVKKVKNEVSMLDLIKQPLWITGMLSIIVFSTVFLTFAQIYIGPALIPALLASGFIVLGIGSVKILGEQLKKEEIIAIALLILGIVMVSLSRLSIEGAASRFDDTGFVIRIAVVSLIMFGLWFGLFFGGRKSSHKPIFMALGAGFPFILGNIWMQPLIVSIGAVFGDSAVGTYIAFFIVSAIIVAFVNIAGIIHLQKALAEGNASIIVPINQVPQQISPIIIYFFVYALAAPSAISYLYLFSGIILVIFAGFLLSKRQSQIEELTTI